jgi:alpha-acetolactate decarboxylase
MNYEVSEKDIAEYIDKIIHIFRKKSPIVITKLLSDSTRYSFNVAGANVVIIEKQNSVFMVVKLGEYENVHVAYKVTKQEPSDVSLRVSSLNLCILDAKTIKGTFVGRNTSNLLSTIKYSLHVAAAKNFLLSMDKLLTEGDK